MYIIFGGKRRNSCAAKIRKKQKRNQFFRMNVKKMVTRDRFFEWNLVWIWMSLKTELTRHKLLLLKFVQGSNFQQILCCHFVMPSFFSSFYAFCRFFFLLFNFSQIRMWIFFLFRILVFGFFMNFIYQKKILNTKFFPIHI